MGHSQKVKPHKRLCLIGLCGVFLLFWRCLPQPLFKDPLATVVFSRDGSLLDVEIARDQQWRFPPSVKIPANVETALIQFEDKRFYRHLGIDPLALARTIRQHLRHPSARGGASTLTMQVIRLARKNPPRTYREKCIEMVMALRLECGARKKTILRMYLDHAPFGGNVVGLEAASWRYFGRAPDHLSWAEACFLAVLPNNPGLLSSSAWRSRVQAKRDRLLANLHQSGILDTLQLRLALQENLPDKPRPLPQLTPHLLQTLQTRYPKQKRFNTTLDTELQLAVQAIVMRRSRVLAKQGIRNAAAMIVDHRDMSLCAYVGNSELENFKEAGYAVDLVQRPRSTGSELKPFLYAAMLEAGELLPGMLVPDLPMQYDGFMPENYDHRYRGAVPAREALARSLNVPFVRLLREYGVSRFQAVLKNMGMTTLFRSPDAYGLTLILGGAEGTLWDLTALYANLASLALGTPDRPQRHYQTPRMLVSDVAETIRPVEISPGAAWLTLQALQEVGRPDEESHWKKFAAPLRVAWKTGTSIGHRDGWAIGMNTRYTVGIWTGNATGEGMPDLTGTAAAAPILFDIFNRVGASEQFPLPGFDLKTVDVCRDDGFLPAEGCATHAQQAPRNSHFERQSPYHQQVHLDRSGRWRVNDGCESISKMTHAAWFLLPSAQEYYFRRAQSGYLPLPPYRKGCRDTDADAQNPISFLYPHTSTRFYIPVGLDTQKEKVVFEAVNRRPDAVLHWHLDGRYLGDTRVFHQQALDIPAGVHRVTVVDQWGHTLSRPFEVLTKGHPPTLAPGLK